MLKITAGIILYVILLTGGDTPSFTLPVLMSMVYGFSIRICMDWGNKTLTFNKSVQQLVYAIGLSWIFQIVWHDAGWQWNVVYATFCISIFSMVIISEGTKLFNMGLRAYSKRIYNNITAKEDYES